jgi:putative membrane protein
MKFRIEARIRALAGFVVLATGVAAAQSPSRADLQFVRESIETNNAEISTAHLALQKASGDDVKLFARQMIHDHTILNEQMLPIANGLDVQVGEGQVSAHDQQIANQLKELRGNAFDQQYIAAMVQGHQKAVSDTKTEASSSQFPPVKSVAQRAEPIIEQHLEMAQKLAQSLHVQVGKP